MHILITGATGGVGSQGIQALNASHIKITAHARNMPKSKALQEKHGVEILNAKLSITQGLEKFIPIRPKILLMF